MRVKRVVPDVINQLQVEASLEANHKSCSVEDRLHKEYVQKCMLPSAASRPDKVVDLPRGDAQDQFIDEVAEGTPVDLGPAMAGRLDRRGVLRYTRIPTPFKHSTSPLDDHQHDTRTHELAL